MAMSVCCKIFQVSGWRRSEELLGPVTYLFIVYVYLNGNKMVLTSSTVCAANHNYGGGNPMRPHRVRLTHSLVSNYGLNSKMYVHRPQARSKEQIEEFHCDGMSCRLSAAS